MIHPKTEIAFINPDVGYGVVATEFIPKGTITWALDKLDREFTREQIEQLDPLYQEILDTYSFRNNQGNFVLCWDHGRYVNHSFHSNCLTTAYDFEIAIRDIHPGEQLTDDYGYLNISEPFRGIDEGTRRKIVYPNDLVKYHPIWDSKLRATFPQVPRVVQPLRSLIPDNIWDKVSGIATGKSEMDSVLSCYYPNPGQVAGT